MFHNLTEADMYLECGTGNKSIMIYNSDKRFDVDVLFARIVNAYRVMQAHRYREIVTGHLNCKLIFSSEEPRLASLQVLISSRPYGIYLKDKAYHKQLARGIAAVTGLEIYITSTIAADIEIGIGKPVAETQAYLVLKDAISELSSFL